jgi:hypothetical protein
VAQAPGAVLATAFGTVAPEANAELSLADAVDDQLSVVLDRASVGRGRDSVWGQNFVPRPWAASMFALSGRGKPLVELEARQPPVLPELASDADRAVPR